MKYLDPKADLTFKKVFGEHPDLVISLLNALLPFETEDEKIVSVEYLPAELFPETPLKKNSNSIEEEQHSGCALQGCGRAYLHS